MRAGITHRYTQHPIRAGELTEFITIQRPEVIRNEYGANDIEWRDSITTRARVIQKSGNRSDENNEIVYNYTTTFVIRWYHNIKEDMRVVWNNRKYVIHSVYKEVYKQSVTIVAELINE